ncbi:MAG TPA: SDR family oxidoreductase [Steroidobacteraceae bacterium]|nr:SDR family oxidoreductase [Steroidobacteraceae bacterium]
MSCFITGATGFLGRYLVRELLARGADGSIFLLLRGASQTKLEQLRQWWGAGSESVIAIDGDLSAPGLGVSAADRSWLRGRVTHFFHLAALYDIEAGDEALQQANVAGTRHALELAQELGASCFHHCSSIAAAGTYSGTFTEDMFEEALGLDHPYFRTKHDAEALVRKQRGVPWRIYRPGMIVGDSRSGHITKVDGPYYFFKALQILRRNVPAWLPTIGLEGGYVNLVPVDYVAAAMVHLSRAKDQDGRCFHLTDPQPRHAGEVLNLFARAGHAPAMGLRLDSELLRFVPQAVSGALRHLGPLHAVGDELLADLQVPRSVLQFLDMPTLFDSTRAQTLLQASDIRLPRLEEYAWRVWDYWERHLDPDLSLDRSLRGAVAGKRVLITGGSSGIGRATALRVAEAGAQVIIAARDAQKLDTVAAEIRAHGGTVYTYACDITDERASGALVQQILATHGGVDILINNAGHSIRRSIAISCDRLHDYERLMQLNYFAAVRLTLAFLPQMTAQHSGHVIVISSIGVLSNAPRFSAYVASKAAIEAFARCAASEYRDQGVHFTVINMPLVRTPMIAPTQAYAKLPAMSPNEAAGLIADAIVHKPPRVATRLGMFARGLELLAPKLADVINNVSFHMFPDSAAARGLTSDSEAPTEDAVAFAKLLHGLHW